MVRPQYLPRKRRSALTRESACFTFFFPSCTIPLAEVVPWLNRNRKRIGDLQPLWPIDLISIVRLCRANRAIPAQLAKGAKGPTALPERSSVAEASTRHSRQCEDAVTAITVRHGRFQSWKRFKPIENLNTIIRHALEHLRGSRIYLGGGCLHYC